MKGYKKLWLIKVVRFQILSATTSVYKKWVYKNLVIFATYSS